MTWQTEITAIVRGLLDDADGTDFTDTRLQQAILASSQLFLFDVKLSKTYVVDVAGSSISPDPTADPRDNVFINLVSLKTACMIAGGLARIAARDGMMVSDGLSKIDTRDAAAWYANLAKQRCDEYKQAKLEYSLGNNNPGHVIVSPFASPDVNTQYDGTYSHRDRIY